MNRINALADRFEAHREQLRAIAYRMLGSASDADDAVQETWLRLQNVDASLVENLSGWLRTVASRVCLDMLRSRRARHEELAGLEPAGERPAGSQGADPEREAVLADGVGRALLVVLHRLGPVERVVFVLHDLFGVPFAEIATIIGRSTVATKKIASRARGRVRSTPAVRSGDLVRNRRVIEAFLAALRAGDVEGVMAVLAPDVVRHADRAAVPAGRPTEVRGARAVTEEIVLFGRNAQSAEAALVGGAVGIVVAPLGRLLLAIRVTIEGDKIAAYELIADPARLRQLDLGVLQIPQGALARRRPRNHRAGRRRP